MADILGDRSLTEVCQSIGDPLLGDFVDVLIDGWDDIADKHEAATEILVLLQRNQSRLAYSHALDSLISSGRIIPLHQLALNLDARVRDVATGIVIRTDALSFLIRIALLDNALTAFAIGSLAYLDTFDDVLASDMWCRLASVAYQQLDSSEGLKLLERRAANSAASMQAYLELGMIRLADAFDQDSVDGIGVELAAAEGLFSRAAESGDGNSTAISYAQLTRALKSIALDQPISHDLVKVFHDNVMMSLLTGQTVPSMEWLHPGQYFLLDWIPFVNKLQVIAQKRSQASWLNAADVLAQFVEVYASARAVRPGARGTEQLLRPVIEAAFIRERGLMAHLIAWIEQDDPPLALRDAQILRENIERRITDGPPGKSPRVVN